MSDPVSKHVCALQLLLMLVQATQTTHGQVLVAEVRDDLLNALPKGPLGGNDA